MFYFVFQEEKREDKDKEKKEEVEKEETLPGSWNNVPTYLMGQTDLSLNAGSVSYIYIL